jgi:hypothetical protein
MGWWRSRLKGVILNAASINWLSNTAPRAIQESLGIMVNYLYDHDTTEDNHEVFVRDGTIVHSPDVDNLPETDPARVVRNKMPEQQ